MAVSEPRIHSPVTILYGCDKIKKVSQGPGELTLLLNVPGDQVSELSIRSMKGKKKCVSGSYCAAVVID